MRTLLFAADDFLNVKSSLVSKGGPGLIVKVSTKARAGLNKAKSVYYTGPAKFQFKVQLICGSIGLLYVCSHQANF